MNGTARLSKPTLFPAFLACIGTCNIPYTTLRRSQSLHVQGLAAALDLATLPSRLPKSFLIHSLMEQSDDKGLNEIFEKHEKPVKPEGLTRDEGLKKKRQNNAQHIALRVARKAQLESVLQGCPAGINI